MRCAHGVHTVCICVAHVVHTHALQASVEAVAKCMIPGTNNNTLNWCVPSLLLINVITRRSFEGDSLALECIL